MPRLSVSGRQQIDERWFIQQPVPGAAFKLNDRVEVIAGEHTGKVGAAISLGVLGAV